jgi:hypothetical protein
MLSPHLARQPAGSVTGATDILIALVSVAIVALGYALVLLVSHGNRLSRIEEWIRVKERR